MCKTLSIGDRIRISRVSADMSQEELAHALGRAGRSYISKIERNQRDLDHGEVIAICKILNVTPNYIFFGNNEQLEGDEQKLIDNFRSLNEEGREIVLNLVDGIVKSEKYKKSAPNGLGQKEA